VVTLLILRGLMTSETLLSWRHTLSRTSNGIDLPQTYRRTVPRDVAATSLTTVCCMYSKQMVAGASNDFYSIYVQQYTYWLDTPSTFSSFQMRDEPG
jgi:hypothetical protein